jgi:hypothetical protein
MDEATITRYITETFEGVDVVVAPSDDAVFFFYDPAREIPLDRRLPFATLVTSDAYDQFSDLNRPSVFRVNIGISKETFRSLFGSKASPSGGGEVEGGYDFTALDRLMPHPVYGRMSWICVLNPGPETSETVRTLLAEAHSQAARRYARARPASGRRD